MDKRKDHLNFAELTDEENGMVDENEKSPLKIVPKNHSEISETADSDHGNTECIFISYSHDSDEHRDLVLRLSERLRRDGLKTELDQYINDSPLQGWPLWMLDKLDEATHVLVICTETYYRRFRGHEAPDKGKGVDWEGALITQELYDARSKTCKFIPVLFESNQEAYIPEPLRSKTHYVLDSEQNYDALYDLLSDQAGVEPGDLGPKKIKQKQKIEPLTFGTTANMHLVEDFLKIPEFTDMSEGSKRFKIALSFPGEHRDFVEQVADYLAHKIGRNYVLYDKYYEAEFARPDLDIYLQTLYRDQSELIAVFLCADYEKKDWCGGLEWRVIREFIKRRHSSSVMPLRFDDTEIPGLFSIDGYVWINHRAPQVIADLILQRYLINSGQPSEESEKNDITPSRQIYEKSDNEFIEIIKRNICNELDEPDVAIFRGEICRQSDKINNPGEGVKGDPTSHPAERMLSLDTHIAIEKVLYNAAMECLDKRGKKFSEAQTHRDAIKQAAQQILGWLVLSSIPYEVLHKTTQDKNLPGLYFKIPVLTEGGVEIIISRKFQRKANLEIKPGGSSVTGNHQVSYKANLFNWQEGATVADIKRSIWNRVFKEDPRDAPLSVTETQRLNAELRSRREDEWYTEHYYLAIEGLDNPSQQHFHNICRQLLTELDELAVVSFGTEEQQKQKLFLVEFALMAAIRKFLTNINKALA